MNELLIMRHAKSDWAAGASDFQRPLNSRGERAADKMAAWLSEEQLCPDRVISSSAVRTRSTAMAVVYHCGVDRSVVDFDDDLYLADDFKWMQVLVQQESARVLICGHNPGLDDLVDYLASSLVPLSASGKLMTTAAVAHFSFTEPWSNVTRGSLELISLTRPKELPS